MHPIVSRSFGGLSRSYYIRNFLFGSIFLAFFYFLFSHMRGMPTGAIVFFGTIALINSLLYPYSRFVYESTVNYVLGDNMFFVNAVTMLTAKIITMLICWYLALLIAPIGLVYLYFRNRGVGAT